MSNRPKRMKFGLFLAPFHRIGENPTLALRRDMELIQLLDDLGYDEVWVGEHHSFAREIIANPMIFIAEAAARTKHLKFGTGVVSIPYHHPLMIADDILQLDHMTRGRVMLGVGPGALTSDAVMMGIDPETQRRRMAEGLDAIMQLFRSDEPVSVETDWFRMTEARLQMAFYSDPHPDVAVAVIATPSGPQLAGKHGVGLLSVAGVEADGFTRVWGWAEEAAQANGQTIDRRDWKAVVGLHIAETRAQAIADVAEGYKRRAYFGDASSPEAAQSGLFAGQAATIEEAIERGAVIVGSPDDAIEAIEKMQERAGGLGGLLAQAHDWADTPKTHQSFELLMRYVAPHFQGQLDRLVASRNFVEERRLNIFGASVKAMSKAFADAGKELPAWMQQAQERQEAAAKEKAAQPSGD